VSKNFAGQRWYKGGFAATRRGKKKNKGGKRKAVRGKEVFRTGGRERDLRPACWGKRNPYEGTRKQKGG